jgi:MGT family glycosyltransferase
MGRPLAYVTLGTIFNVPELYRPLLDGLGALGGRVAALVTVGRTVDADALGVIPARVRVEQYVPQARVLPSCDVVVNHGGSGTTFGALAHGLPMLLVPKGADQFDNAARCAQAGAAIVLPPDEVTAVAVRDALTRLLEQASFRASAKHIAAEIAAMPSPAEAATRVVEAVRRRGGPSVA